MLECRREGKSDRKWMRVRRSPKHPALSHVIAIVGFYPVMGAICLSHIQRLLGGLAWPGAVAVEMEQSR